MSTPSPISTAVEISTACTQKNAVGALSQCAPAHARSSSTIAFANRGQMTTLNRPASTRNPLAFRPITHPVSQES